MALSLFVKHEFGDFYRALFDRQVQQDRIQSIYLYFADLPKRFESEAANLATLTGWELNTIRNTMATNGQSCTVQAPKKLKWYQKLWKQ